MLTLSVLPAVVQFTALALWYNVNDHKLDPRLTAPAQLLVAVLFIGVGQVSLMLQLSLQVIALLHDTCTCLTATLILLTRSAAASQLQHIQSHWRAWGVLWNQGKMPLLRLSLLLTALSLATKFAGCSWVTRCPGAQASPLVWFAIHR